MAEPEPSPRARIWTRAPGADRGRAGGGGGRRRHRPARQHHGEEAGGEEPLLPGRGAERRHRGPGDLGQELPAPVRRLPAHRGPAAHEVRRQRGASAFADRGRPALGRGPVPPRRRPAPQEDVGRLRLLGGLPQEARPRLHARRPDVHGAGGEVQAAGHLHPLPRLGLRAVQEGGRRRPHQGLRALQPDAVPGGPGRTSPTPSAASTATTRPPWRCGSRGPASWRASGR